MIEASAPAKIILFGEHAVVYNHPAIAVPLSSLRARAKVVLNNPTGQGLRINAPDMGILIEYSNEADIDNSLVEVTKIILTALDVPPPDVTIHLYSDIPLASGLGSGAAISTVLARVLSTVVNRPFTQTELNAVVYQTEAVHHGTPSGIDNTVIVYERPVYFVRNQPIEPIQIPYPFQLIVADTGIRAPTKIPVSDVRRIYDSSPEKTGAILSEIGSLTQEARQAIESGNITAIGRLMNRNHTLLQQLTVSSTELDHLVASAVKAEALGAKLSGAGRGGNMIALVTTESIETVQNALQEVGASRIFSTTVGT